MLGCVAVALHKYKHTASRRQQNSPHQWKRPIYGPKQQMAHELDTLSLLPIKEKPASNLFWEHFYIVQGQLNPLCW